MQITIFQLRLAPMNYFSSPMMDHKLLAYRNVALHYTHKLETQLVFEILRAFYRNYTGWKHSSLRRSFLYSPMNPIAEMASKE
jgi:hypothetical protein